MGRRRQSILLPMHLPLEIAEKKAAPIAGEVSMNAKTRPSGLHSPKISSSQSKKETPKLPDRMQSNN